MTTKYGVAAALALGLWIAPWVSGQAPGPQLPATRPSAPMAGRWTERSERPERPAAERGYWRRGDSPSTEEWTQVRDFMREHSPRRWELFQQMPEESERYEPIRRFILTRWRNLQTAKSQQEQHPALYEARVRRLELEDHVFGLVSDMRQTPDRKPVLREQLRKEVAELVGLGFAERQNRLDHLSRMLQSETEQLAQDRANENAMIKAQMEMFLTQGGDSLDNPPPEERRGGGPDGRGPGPGPGARPRPRGDEPRAAPRD